MSDEKWTFRSRRWAGLRAWFMRNAEVRRNRTEQEERAKRIEFELKSVL